MKRVVFHLTDEQYERLKALAKRMGVSKKEALRRAVEIYQIIREVRQESAERRENGNEEERGFVEIIG